HEDGSVGALNEAPVLEFREVTNSGGQSESRPVIQTPLKLGTVYKLVELTLTQRDNMAYRMLLGRTTLSADFVVAPSESFLQGGDNTQPGTSE
ncbi:MAG: RimK/LysX family protein, partial [Luminiphilus sp.]|nr:RimK/LysX family protein [Luminiphilus sp.]